MIRKTLGTITAALVIAVMSANANAAIIASFDFEGTSNPDLGNDAAPIAGITVTPIFNAGGGFNTGSQNNGESQHLGLSSDGIAAFTVTIDDTVTLDLIDLDFDARAGTNGVTSRNIVFDINNPTLSTSDNYFDTGGMLGRDQANNGFQTYTPDLAIPAFQGLTDTAITFYFREQVGTRSEIDNIILNGTVTAIPEPASLAMGMLGLTLIAGRRRR
jgi:MYXO-CTERM domain-containing protein